MVLDVVLHGEGNGARERIAAVGVAVDVVVLLFVDPVVNLVADQGGGNGRVPAG